jgi:flagellar biosynthesis/type III secretory pathway protein FliH
MIRLLKANQAAAAPSTPDISRAIARITKAEWDAQVRARRLQREAIERANALEKKAQEDIQRELERASLGLQKKYDLALAESLVALQREFEQRWQQCQQVVATAAIAVAERVVHRLLDQDDQALLAWVSDSLAALGSQKQVQISAHPRVCQRLEPLARKVSIAFEPDSSRPEFEVVLTTDVGTARLSVRDQVEHLVRLLEGDMRAALQTPSR